MFMDLFNGGIGAIKFLVKNANLDSACMGLEPVIRIVKYFVRIIQFGVPILLIIFGMIDLGKAVMSSKDDEMKKAQSMLLKRFIYAVAVFLVITLVSFIMGVVAGANAEDADDDSWSKCWTNVKI